MESVMATTATAGASSLGGSLASGAASSGGGMLSGLFSNFSLLTSLGGAGMQIASGQMESDRFKMQAEQNTLNARIEKVNAEEKALEIRRQLLSNIGSANATFAARGIGLGSGTPEQARTESAKNASDAIEKARFGGEMKSNERLAQAGQDRINARSAKVSGYGSALSSLSKLKSSRSLLDY